jgi:hypothetical protein
MIGDDEDVKTETGIGSQQIDEDASADVLIENFPCASV